MLIGFSGSPDGIGILPTFPPQTPAAFKEDAHDLDGRIQKANMLVISAAGSDAINTANGLPPKFIGFPYAQWADFVVRWQNYLSRVDFSFWNIFITPNEQNAYWAEFDGFLLYLSALGYVDIAPRPVPIPISTDINSTMSTITKFAIFGGLIVGGIYLLPVVLPSIKKSLKKVWK